MSRGYKITYDVKVHDEPVPRDQIPEGHGACDRMVLVSIVDKEDGGLSYQAVPLNCEPRHIRFAADYLASMGQHVQSGLPVMHDDGGSGSATWREKFEALADAVRCHTGEDGDPWERLPEILAEIEARASS